MKLVLTAILFFSCSSLCIAQKNNTDSLKYGDIIFAKAEVDAQFPGGEKAWREYLTNNFKVTEVAKQMPRKEFTYKETVIVKFVIKADGTLTAIKAENEVSIALKNEAIRLILESPTWIPAMQNGKKVNIYHRQPISIEIANK